MFARVRPESINSSNESSASSCRDDMMRKYKVVTRKYKGDVLTPVTSGDPDDSAVLVLLSYTLLTGVTARRRSIQDGQAETSF